MTCDWTGMIQTDIDRERLICFMGMTPVKPAEFVWFALDSNQDAAAYVSAGPHRTSRRCWDFVTVTVLLCFACATPLWEGCTAIYASGVSDVLPASSVSWGGS